MMPLEEVMVLARKLHVMLGKSTDKLEKWASEEGAKGVDGDNYLFGVRDRSFTVDCEIRHSFGHIFPWALIIHASWRKADTEAVNLPLPFTAEGLVSLDPPSGKRYTAAEDARFYKENYGHTGPSSPTPWRMPGPQALSTNTPPNPPAPEKEHREDEAATDNSSWWWLSFGCALLVTILIFGFLRLRALRLQT
jgi:hypothetical protein